MPSELDAAKRELVKLLECLALKYGLRLQLDRESANKEVEKAFRRVALRVHPDKGGHQADFQKLSAVNDAWKDLLKNRASAGRPEKPPEERRKQRGKAGKPSATFPVAAARS